jgi:hypothetical protein
MLLYPGALALLRDKFRPSQAWMAPGLHHNLNSEDEVHYVRGPCVHHGQWTSTHDVKKAKMTMSNIGITDSLYGHEHDHHAEHEDMRDSVQRQYCCNLLCCRHPKLVRTSSVPGNDRSVLKT